MNTTTTRPRVLTTHDGRYGFVTNSTVLVSTGNHDHAASHHNFPSYTVHEGEVSFHVTGSTEHATFWMTTEEARLFAQAILDATA